MTDRFLAAPHAALTSRWLARAAAPRHPGRRGRPLAVLAIALLAALLPLVAFASGPFTDIAGSPHAADIEALRQAGVAEACKPAEPTKYCPKADEQRDDLAGYIARAAGLGDHPPVANAKTAETATNATNATNAQNAVSAQTAQIALSAPNAQPKYKSTIVVSPVGDPVRNGEALKAALLGITDASAVNPRLLKIEPGVYELGKNTLTMKPFVDIEGSGEAVTTIHSSPEADGAIAVVAVANVELRFLSIVYDAAPDQEAFAVFIEGVGARPSLAHVTVIVRGSNVGNHAVRVVGFAQPFLQNVRLVAIGKGGALESEGAFPHLDSSRLTTINGATALRVSPGSGGPGGALVTSSEIGGPVDVDGGKASCIGAYRSDVASGGFVPTNGTCQ